MHGKLDGPAMVLLHWLEVRRMQHPTQSEHRRQQVSQVSHQVYVRAGEQMHVCACMHGEYLAITHVHCMPAVSNELSHPIKTCCVKRARRDA